MSHGRADEDFRTMLDNAKKLVKIGGRYRHFKGNEYIVKDLAIKEDTLEVVVIYEAQYGDKLTWARDLNAWLEKIEIDGKLIERFARI